MGWRKRLGVVEETIFNEQIDTQLINLGFKKALMRPYYSNAVNYPVLEDKPCFTYSGDISESAGKQVIWLNEREVFIERLTPLSGFLGVDHHLFLDSPTTFKEIEDVLEDLVE